MRDVAQQPGDGGVPDDERDHGRDDRRAPAVGVVAVRDLLELEEPGADHRRDRQQEGVAGRGLAVVAEEPAHRDRRAGAGDARAPARSACATPISTASRSVICLSVAVGAADPVRDAEDDAQHDQRGADDPEAAEVLLDDVLEQHAEDHDRQRADDDEPAHPGVEVAAVLRLEQRPHPRRADPPDVLAEVDQHRELGADLDDRGERRARVAPAEAARGRSAGGRCWRSAGTRSAPG